MLLETMILSFRNLIIVLVVALPNPVLLCQYTDDYYYNGSGAEFEVECECKLNETAIHKNVRLPTGWPLFLPCRLCDIPDGAFMLENNSTLQCHVIDVDNNVTLLNQTEPIRKSENNQIVYTKSKVDGNSPLRYKIITSVLNASDELCLCSVTEVELQVEEFKQKTCEEVLQSAYENDPLELMYQQQRILDCSGAGATLGEEFFENADDYEVNWYRNCSSTPSGHNKELTIAVEFEDAGTYTCAVTYSGMTLYASTYRFCVYHGEMSIPPVILCPEEGKVVEAGLGENFLVSMKVAVGSGHFDLLEFYADWQKPTVNGSMKVCYNSWMDQQEPGRISCILQQSVGDSCFDHIAGEEERKPKENHLTSTLNITNLQPGDFGEYFLKLTSTAHPDPTPARCRIRVVERKRSNLQQLILAFIFLFLFLLFAVGTFGYFFVFFKVHYKRRFGKTHQADCYNVFISYHAIDLDTEEREQLKLLIDVCDNTLTKLGCQVFVENRDGNSTGSSQVKTIEDLAMDSDLVVLFMMSCGALEDTWSVSKFQKIYEKSVDSKMEIFFVVDPEIREMIKKEESSNCALIKKAMKENHVVEWDGEERRICRRGEYWLRLELENVVPKIGKYQKIPKIQINAYSDDKSDVSSIANI